MQAPSLLPAVTFCPEQDSRLELVQRIPISQDEGNGTVFSGARDIDTELPGSRVHPRANLDIDLGIAIRDAGNRCGAYICKSCDVAKRGLRLSHFAAIMPQICIMEASEHLINVKDFSITRNILDISSNEWLDYGDDFPVVKGEAPYA
jgi:hypothetical protein